MSSMSAFVSTAEEMQFVKAALGKAPAGPKREAALIHRCAAEKAQAQHEDADCLKALSATTAALE